MHSHETGQPFTRDAPIRIPAGLRTVTVEVHDTVHGTGGKRVRVDLGGPRGPDSEVVR